MKTADFALKLRDSKFYCENFLKIKNKKGQVVPFVFNAIQDRIFVKIQELRAQKKPVRLIILKARQEGVSTLSEGLIFHETITNFYRNSLIIAHDPEATEALFNMCKFFHDNLGLVQLTEALANLQEPVKYSNRRSLVFENPDEKTKADDPGMRSRIDVATANKVEARGRTIHNFHGSEVAFWPNAEKLMLALNQMIPEEPDTMTILESTGNGVGGYFYDTFWDAMNGRNDYTALFFGWQDFPEYRRPLDADFVLTPEEVELKERLRIDDEQVNWRRHTIRNKCGGDLLKFQQEYPATAEEAFITSGTPKFNIQNLQIMMKYRRPPIFEGEIDGGMKPQLTPTHQGRLKMYKYPDPRSGYVVGGDTAKGTVNSDFSCLQVYDVRTGDFVATWHGKIDPVNLAHVVFSLGFFYAGADKCALAGIEVNMDGITTNKVLYQKKYPRLYKRRDLLKKDERQADVIGFHTGANSRPLVLNLLGEFINLGEGELNDVTTLMECMTFVIGPSGKPEAQEGCHDDTVLATSIALHLANYVPSAVKKETPTEVRQRMITEAGTEEDQFWKNKKSNDDGPNW